MHPIPPYLSEDNAVTVDMFMQSDYASEYKINTSNIHWAGFCTKGMYSTFMLSIAPQEIQPIQDWT